MLAVACNSVCRGALMSDYHSFGIEPATNRESEPLESAPVSTASEPENVLARLQRNGSALAACECGSHNWLPPDGIYQLQAVAARQSPLRRLPTKAIVPLTCAACGFTKFYDPTVVTSRAESGRDW